MDVKHSCRCCLRRPPDRDLTTPYTLLGETEIYNEMLKQCFNIHLVLGDAGLRGICSACVDRLRDACYFKLQVEGSQETLQERLQGGSRVKEEESTVEPESQEGDGTNEVLELSLEPPVKPEMLDADWTPGEMLCEEPPVKPEILDADWTPGEMLYEMPGPKMEDDAGTSEDNEPMSHACYFKLQVECSQAELQGVSGIKEEEPAVQPEMQEGDGTNEELELMYSDGGARAREQLAMACSVVLERLRGDAAAYSRDNLYICDHCDKRFSNNYTLKKHIQKTHFRSTTPIKPSLLIIKPYKCNHCAYKCSKKSKLQVHQRIHTGEKPYKCTHCDKKFRDKGYLVQHQRIHTGEKVEKCSHCDYKSCHKGTLRAHQRIHTGEKPYKCSHCDYKCTQKGNLDSHQRIHASEKPYQCNYCDYKCTRTDHLKIHQMKHTGEKPYKCSHCDYKCSTGPSLRKHEMNRHNDEKRFQCNICDYKCNFKSALQMHQMKHTGAMPFICSHCNYANRLKQNLLDHLRRKHPELFRI